ncbi:MAG: cation:proton antiporter, partial [bacterium]
MNYLIALAIFLIAGYAFGRGAGKIRLPEVVGFIVFGALIGPSALGLFSRSFLENFAVIEIVALSFIAYQIGGELGVRQLHREGKALGILVFSQATMAYLFVAGLLWFWTGDLFLSLILAATAVATAPGAVKAVLDESRAGDEFTKFLYHVMAIDDFFAILFFALTVSLLGARSQFLLHAGREIVGALILGILLGYGIHWLRKHHARMETLLIYEVGGLFLGAGISMAYDFSYLLTGMAFGFTLVNLSGEDHHLFVLSRRLERMIYVIFFVLVGTQLE